MGMTDIFKPVFEDWNPNGNLGTIPAKAGKANENGPKLNSTKINDFFLSKVEQYCELILRKKYCPYYDLSGCGIDHDCPIGKTCIEENTSSPSFGISATASAPETKTSFEAILKKKVSCEVAVKEGQCMYILEEDGSCNVRKNGR